MKKARAAWVPSFHPVGRPPLTSGLRPTQGSAPRGPPRPHTWRRVKRALCGGSGPAALPRPARGNVCAASTRVLLRASTRVFQPEVPGAGLEPAPCPRRTPPHPPRRRVFPAPGGGRVGTAYSTLDIKLPGDTAAVSGNNVERNVERNWRAM